jgi:hypothetical protein
VNAWLLGRLVRLLPAGRAEWGEAMQAELAQLTAGRTPFVLGCAWAVVSRPVGLARAGWSLVRLAALAAAVALAATVSSPAIRLEGLVAAALLVGVVVLLPLIAAPAAPGRAAQLVAVVGTAAVLGEALFAMLRLHAWFPPDPDLGNLGQKLGVVVIVLACYVLAVARVTSAGAGLSGRTLAVGGAAGSAAALLWLLLVLVRPGLASEPWSGVLLVVGAALVASALAPRHRAVAALLAATGSSLLTVVVMDVLPLTPWWDYHADPPSQVWPAPPRVTDPVAMAALGVLAALALILLARRRSAVGVSSAPRREAELRS